MPLFNTQSRAHQKISDRPDKVSGRKMPPPSGRRKQENRGCQRRGISRGLGKREQIQSLLGRLGLPPEFRKSKHWVSLPNQWLAGPNAGRQPGHEHHSPVKWPAATQNCCTAPRPHRTGVHNSGKPLWPHRGCIAPRSGAGAHGDSLSDLFPARGQNLLGRMRYLPRLHGVARAHSRRRHSEDYSSGQLAACSERELVPGIGYTTQPRPKPRARYRHPETRRSHSSREPLSSYPSAMPSRRDFSMHRGSGGRYPAPAGKIAPLSRTVRFASLHRP